MGIDGGSLDWILNNKNKNLLTNFKKILNDGFSSHLRVSIPPVTIPSWPTLFSGLTPEQLGYYWFNHPQKGLFNSNVWKEKSIFSLKQLKQFVLNVPGTFPAWRINGEMIAGAMSPSFSAYPLELKFFYGKNWILDGATGKEIVRAFKMKSRLFLKKMEEDFNLLVFVIRMPDVMSHHVHLDIESIINHIDLTYKLIDEFLGEILNSNNFDNILIISDHGLKHYRYEFNISRWLEKEGLLFINRAKGRKIYSLIAKIFDNFRPFLKIDYKKYRKIKNRFLKRIIDDSIIIDESITSLNKAKQFNSNVGGLFLEEKDKVKKHLIKQHLEKDKRIREVLLNEIEGFPDLFIILNDKYIFNHESSFFIIRGRNIIMHSQKGLFLAYGKSIKQGTVSEVDYKDIAPTILKMFNIEKLAFMSGAPIDIFKKN